MAVDSKNDSYNRCLAELRARYQGRGVVRNAHNELEREAASRAELSESYVLFDSRSKIADRYRSGEYNGSKYMTSDDFVRYFKNRRDFYMPEALREREAEAAKNTAVPQRKTARGLVSSDSDSKEGHLKTITALVRAFVEKWFPMESKEGRTNGARFRIPMAVLGGMAVFTVSLGLIVGGSVMIGSASGEIGRQNSTIATLEAQKLDLEGKLDLKYNLNEIEAEAESLGMIKRHYAEHEYLTVNQNEEIVLHDEEKEKGLGLAALLSAFGIDIDGE